MPTNNDDIVLDSAQQAAMWKELGDQLTGTIKQSMLTGTSSSNPLAMADSLAAMMRAAGTYDIDLIETIEELAADTEVQNELTKFQQGLDGNPNVDISEVGTQLPGMTEPLTGDDGVNGRVILGNEGDLLRYSNYFSDSGVRFGGFVKDAPNRILKFVNTGLGLRLSKTDALKQEWAKTSKVFEQKISSTLDVYNVGPGKLFPRLTTRQIASLPKNAEGLTVFQQKDKAFASIQSQILAEQTSTKGRVRAKDILSKASVGMKGIGSLFGIAQGAVTATVGATHDKDLRLGGGVLGIANGIAGFTGLFNEKIAAKYAAKVTAKAGIAAGVAAGKKAARFIPVAGTIIGVGAGIQNITANSLAADEARRGGNHGRAAMYGVMAALESVTVVLDIVSGVLDFIPGIGTAVSFVIDIVSTIIGLFSDLIGLFTHLVDTRTEEEKLKESFDEYVDSDGFKKFLDTMAESYKTQGYDVFKYSIDSQEAGFDAEADAHNKTKAREVVRNLTEDAKNGLDGLRLAVIDNTWKDNPLTGGMFDDLLQAQKGGSKNLYGYDGDDRLYAAEYGTHSLYGGKGNDYLYAPLGQHKLYGEEGDDTLVGTPGLTRVLDGGPGTDTLIVNNLSTFYHNTAQEIRNAGPHELSFAENSVRGQSSATDAQVIVGRGVYIDLDKKIGGFKVDEAHSLTSADVYDSLAGHTALFTDSAEVSQVQSLFSRNGTHDWGVMSEGQLHPVDTNLWLLTKTSHSGGAETSYLTDGRYLYRAYRSVEQGVEQISFSQSYFKLTDISDSIVSFETQGERNDDLASYGTDSNGNTILKHFHGFGAEAPYLGNGPMYISGGFYAPQNKVEASLYLHFASTELVQDIENVNLNVKGSVTVLGDYKNNIFNIGRDVSDGSTHTPLVINAATQDSGIARQTYLNGRGGDDVFRIERANFSIYSPENYLNSLSINGGEGNDALVISNINFGDNLYILQDKDDAVLQQTINPTTLDGRTNVITLESVESVVLESVGMDIDASRLSNGLSFTVESGSSANIITTDYDDRIRLIDVGSNSNSSFTNTGGDDSLDFSLLKGTTGINVNLENGTISGPFTGTVTGIDSVMGSRNSDIVSGNENENTLIAFGDTDYIFGEGGSDQLFAQRGQHYLDGGEGSDAYTIDGPIITEQIAINVSMPVNSIESSALNGTWSNGQLVIDVLGASRDELQLMTSSLQFIDSSGNPVVTKGSISVVNNKLVYNPGNDFNTLERHDVETLYLQYQSSGSFAEIDDSGLSPDVLRTGGFTSINDIHFDIEALSNNLQVKDAQGNLVFVDFGFGEALAAGLTSISALASDFAKRFTQWALTDTDIVLDSNEIFDLVNDGLAYKVTESGSSPWDKYLQGAGSVNANGELEGGSGDDTIVLDDGSIYLSKTGDGNDTVIANELLQGSSAGYFYVQLGGGDNVIIVGDQPKEVYVYKLTSQTLNDNNTLVFDDLTPDQITTTFSNFAQRFSVGNNEIVALGGTNIFNAFSTFAFKGDDRTIIIDGNDIITQLNAGANYDYVKFLNADEEQGLHLTSYNQSQLNLDVKRGTEGLVIDLKVQGNTVYTVNISNTELVTATAIDLGAIAISIATDLSAGIEFSNTTLEMHDVGEYFINLLQDNSRHTLGSGLSLVDEGDAGYADEIQYITNLDPRKDVAILDASFEQWGTPNWTGSSFGQESSSSAFEVLDGDYSLVIGQGGSASQTLAATFDTTVDYQLSVDIGSSSLVLPSGASFKVWAGATQIAAVEFTASEIAAMGRNSWQSLTVDIDGGAHAAANGGALRVELINTSNDNNRTFSVDNVQLTKLIGAMATFDHDAGTGGSGGQESPYTLQPVLAAAV